MLSPDTVSFSCWLSEVEEDDVEAMEEAAESTMELERPGEEKKKRWEAKAVAKSGVGGLSIRFGGGVAVGGR
ncbi:UNVERIFIED_CONTAM: hypothetical protein Sradi_1402100 [Sesamum radiatum]|uniref:Uncharacterized protein n=1 Tax=Sesamum radiatum TaxID=300843 RepID=A0AAW2URM6_SESRA